jgi:hypothetical protein
LDLFLNLEVTEGESWGKGKTMRRELATKGSMNTIEE